MEEHDGFTGGNMRRDSGESLTFQINVCFYPKPLEKLNDDTTDTLLMLAVYMISVYFMSSRHIGSV